MTDFFLILTGVLFLLRVFRVYYIPWLWVFAPIWLPLAIIFSCGCCK